MWRRRRSWPRKSRVPAAQRPGRRGQFRALAGVEEGVPASVGVPQLILWAGWHRLCRLLILKRLVKRRGCASVGACMVRSCSRGQEA